jgi:branched-chain amino acid transport system permease protein
MNELAEAIPWLGRNNPKAARAVVIAIMLLAPIVALMCGNTWVRILDFALLYVMLALGLNLVVGFAGLLDLGYIAFYGVGAYTWAFLASPHFGLHFPFFVVLPLGAAFAACAGIILGFPVLRLRGDYLAIVTLGFGEIVRIFLNNLNYPVNVTNGPQGINMLDTLSIFGWDVTRPIEITESFHISPLLSFYYIFLLFVILSVIIIRRLQISRIGRGWAAIRDDELAAKAIGINTRNMKLLAFSLGATFGGVAGGLFGCFQGFVSPESFSLMESIAILTMVVFGGMGNLGGVIVGAVALSLLPEVLRGVALPIQQSLFGQVLLDPEVLRMLLLSLAMILMMLLRPAGLLPAHARYSRTELIPTKKGQA